jgi:hypothetical protein
VAKLVILAAFVLVTASCSDDDGTVDFIDTPGDDAAPVEEGSPISTLVASFEDWPPETPAGEDMVVTVVLTNPGDEPVALDPCPAHSVTVGESSISFNAGPWLLNCEAMPEIGANSSASFEVVIPVPEDSEVGDADYGNSVSWRLLPHGFVGVTLTIGGPL